MNILFISHDVVGSAMAGPGIRAAELSRVLAREHAVTLVAPQPPDQLPDGVRGHSYTFGDPASLATSLDAAELIVANGFVLLGHPELSERPVPLVLDLYDPTPLENVALLREHDPAQRAERGRGDVALLVGQLRAGDCFLCATERQRDLYLGALLSIGRITPALTDSDPTLRSLLRVVPFGLPSEPPVAAPPPWADLDPDALVVLWSGGLWDWMDPLTLVRAMPRVIEAVPQARLVFLAGSHPGNLHPMQAPARARALAAELGLLDRQVLFVERWLPYAERAGALRGAAIAIYLHEESLESRYAAMRSRFLDHLWAGLPSVVSTGDAAAALVESEHLGRVVAPGDVAGTADALIALLSDEAERRGCAERARALAAEYTWDRVAAPLLDFCRAPRRAPDRPIAVEPPAEQAPRAEPEQRVDRRAEVEARDRRAHEQDASRNAALGALAASWQVAERPLPGGLIGRIRRLLVDHVVRPFVAPIVEQQNIHNAAVLRALDALAESADVRRSDTYELLDRQALRLAAVERAVDQRLAIAELQLSIAERRLGSIDGQISDVYDQLVEIQQHLDDLDDADTALAGRVALLPAEQPLEPPR